MLLLGLHPDIAGPWASPGGLQSAQAAGCMPDIRWAPPQARNLGLRALRRRDRAPMTTLHVEDAVGEAVDRCTSQKQHPRQPAGCRATTLGHPHVLHSLHVGPHPLLPGPCQMVWRCGLSGLGCALNPNKQPPGVLEASKRFTPGRGQCSGGLPSSLLRCQPGHSRHPPCPRLVRAS